MDPQSRTVYAGRVIDVGVDTVQLPNGHEMELEVIRHPGGSAVAALDGQQRVCLLRQYRHAAGGWLWELPAGRIDVPEKPLETARRELAEEAGVVATEWHELGSIISSPGVFTEVIHLYLARCLEPTAPVADVEELIEVHWIDFEVALSQAQSGDIVDAKTIVGLFRAAKAM